MENGERTNKYCLRSDCGSKNQNVTGKLGGQHFKQHRHPPRPVAYVVVGTGDGFTKLPTLLYLFGFGVVVPAWWCVAFCVINNPMASSFSWSSWCPGHWPKTDAAFFFSFFSFSSNYKKIVSCEMLWRPCYRALLCCGLLLLLLRSCSCSVDDDARLAMNVRASDASRVPWALLTVTPP